MSLSAGTRLGPYEIVDPLGAGGMGEVYRAKDTRLGRDVAIKVLPEVVSNDPRALARFESEAKAVAALSHPNILALFDVGKEAAVSFVVTELLEGETLREALAKGPLSLRKALDVALQVAEGLAAAHGKGIVHRDVKPENVFLTRDGHAKLLDFGLARSRPVSTAGDETQSPTVDKLTSEGVVLGTVAYMSPEQARGQTVDFRSDQFSLGIVLYEMLTGKRPFGGASAAETLTAIIREEPEPVTKLDPKLPALVGWIVQRCLGKDPEERYSSTKDLAKELQNLRTRLSEAVSAANVAPGEGPRLRGRLPYWMLAAVAVLAAVFGVLVGPRFARTGSPPASPLRFSLSFPVDAEPRTHEHNPFALSPDGRTLVFEGVTEGGDLARSKLFVRRLDLDEIRPIPGTDAAGADFPFSSPFMSPDGLEVGFFAEGKLKRVSLAGGSPITLCDAPSPRGGSWGPDGTIVFVPSPTSGLWRIPASGGEARRVTSPDAAKGEYHVFPQILPDGEHVLFTFSGKAAVVSLRTGEQRVVMEDAVRARYLPTGHLVFARPGTLLAVPFSLKRLETSGSPVPVLEGLVTNSNFTGAAEYAFSQEGTLVYAASRQLQRTLVWVDRKGAMERVPLPPGGYEEVALSPDGGRLVAITVDKNYKEALLIGDFPGGTLSRSAAEGAFQRLAWAPDGKRVAFGFSPGRKDLRAAYWQGADGSTPPERLTGDAPRQNETPTSFSPDGSLLLVDVYIPGDTSPNNDIFALPLNGEKTLRPFLQTKFGESAARFSPDGRWVVYQSNESGPVEIFVRPYPGPGGKWQISTEGGDEPCWSRSGRELFYWQGGDKMMVVDVETKPTFRAGRARTLFEGRYLSHGVNYYDVTSDGTRFLMIKEDPAESGPAQVKVVLNWFEEVKRRIPGAK